MGGIFFFFFRLSGLAAGLLLFVRQRVSFCRTSVDGAERRTAGVDGWGMCSSRRGRGGPEVNDAEIFTVTHDSFISRSF